MLDACCLTAGRNGEEAAAVSLRRHGSEAR